MKLDIFINDWLNSWTGNNPNALLEYYSENTFYIDPANPNGLKGKEELAKYFTKLLQKNPHWLYAAYEIIPTQKGCTLKWKAQIPVGDELIVLFGLDIIEIAEWKITRNEVYFDRWPWLEMIKRQTAR